jgi:hypothetical protein
MPSTPSVYPQVASRCFMSFRVLKLSISQVSTIFGLGSIPGSSTKEKLVKAQKPWPAFYLP